MIPNALNGPVRDASLVTLSLLAWNIGVVSSEANPTGGTVAQGAATFNTSGSQFTINSTAVNTVINWQSFNVGAGETTTFVEPTSTSVVWNHINDANPSQILGNINANGYVVLQNQNGFVVGGNAAIKAAGLVMTTSPTPAPNLSSGGAWEFDAPPPASQIINYGQITTAGGPAYLIANQIENNGTISAQRGQIGLYAGQQVLLSTSPTGLGLSAKVTLPQGSVDNEGKLIADGGTIQALAQTVNQNGTVQANTVQNVNGVIELVASGNLTVGPSSDIEANGDSSANGLSPAGFVILQAGASYSDTASSVINVAGANGGQDGIVEVLGTTFTPNVQSQIGQKYACLINPYDLVLSTAPTDLGSLNLNVTDLGNYAQIDLHALDNIELSSAWGLKDPSANNSGAWGSLSLSAGNNIILDDGSSIRAGNNWNVNLTAGTSYAAPPGQAPAPGTGGIYLGDGQGNGGLIQTQNGDINLWAANELNIANVDLSGGSRSGAIRTLAGGNINVTTEYGGVNAGNDPYGYQFGLALAPYYRVYTGLLGGISTAAGGNVTINAGGDVTAYLPTQADYNNNGAVAYDGGVGAFGSQPGNVSITAGGSVYGNYVVANGVGVITAAGNAGVASIGQSSQSSLSSDFALSLIKGSWTVNAQNIYLDDVLNPNGVFNDSTSSSTVQGAHVFNYDPAAALTLNAPNGAIEITGGDVPLLPGDAVGHPIPILLPPVVQMTAGAGGITLGSDVIIFPSPDQSLHITTLSGGDFNAMNGAAGNIFNLIMSDSANRQWDPAMGNSIGSETFGYTDHASTLLQFNNGTPAEIQVSGNMNGITVYADKQTTVSVGGNMFNSSLVGQNLSASDVTSINVGGNVSYSPIYSWVTLPTALPANWELFFYQLVNPVQAAIPIPATEINDNSYLRSLALNCLAFPVSSPNPGFVYDATTKQLGFAFQMNGGVVSAMQGMFGQGSTPVWETIVFNSSGAPETRQGADGNYYFVTAPITPFVSPTVIGTLAQSSVNSVQDATHISPGFQIGGPGALDVNVGGSLNLGATYGIISWGGANGTFGSDAYDYTSLAALTGNAGANVKVTAGGDITMLTSTIASIGGGNVEVDSGGEIDLGLGGTSLTPNQASVLSYGIYTAGAGNVTVTAQKDINIDTARIATFNGGNVFVESYHGDVNAGNGVNLDLQIPFYYYDSSAQAGLNDQIQNPRPYGSGILALSPSRHYQVRPGSARNGSELPGNITVITPNGNIVSSQGGIAQFALNGNVAGGPTINLIAGTPGVAATSSQGNINLGQGGVIGGTVNLTAQGSIKGLIVSRQDTTVKAVQNVDVTVLASGNANVSAGGALSGTLIGVSGVNASGAGGISATMLSANVTAGGASQNTLGTASASTASQSAANQSNTDAKEEMAANNAENDDQKKKTAKLTQRVKRVTVILPKS